MNLLAATSLLFIPLSGIALGSSVRGAEPEHERHIMRSLQHDTADSAVVIDDLYEKVGDDAYDQFLETFYQLKMEIESMVLEVNPDLDAEGVADVARKFIDLLDEDADAEDDASGAGQPDIVEEDADSVGDASGTILPGVADEIPDKSPPSEGEEAGAGPPPEEEDAVGSSLKKVDNGGNSGMQRGRYYYRSSSSKSSKSKPSKSSKSSKSSSSYSSHTSSSSKSSKSSTSFYKYYNKGCRNKHGGKGSRYYDYDLYRHVSHGYCRSKCSSLEHHCYGYEYSHNKRCEVWRVPIRYVQYSNGRDCYKKN